MGISRSPLLPPDVQYRERLWAPWGWWLAGLGMAVLIAKEVTMGVPTLPEWLPYVLLIAVAVGVLLWLSHTTIEVVSSSSGRELRAGHAHIPASVVRTSAQVPRTAKSSALGRQLDPAAFVLHRVWVGPMVLLVLNDPDDPTPYWLISCRHPDRVLAALHDQLPPAD